MVDVFSEVDEELRHDKLKRLGKKYGPFVIGGIVLFIGAMGGRVYWDEYVTTQRIAESEQYQQAMTALAAGDRDAAMTGFEALIGEAKYGYGLLARLQAASSYAAQGRAEEALAALPLATQLGGGPLPLTTRSPPMGTWKTVSGISPASWRQLSCSTRMPAGRFMTVSWCWRKKGAPGNIRPGKCSGCPISGKEAGSRPKTSSSP